MEFPGGLSVKDLKWSLLWPGLLLCAGSIPGPGNFFTLQGEAEGNGGNGGGAEESGCSAQAQGPLRQEAWRLASSCLLLRLECLGLSLVPGAVGGVPFAPTRGRPWVLKDAQEGDGWGIFPQGAFPTCSCLRHSSAPTPALPLPHTVCGCRVTQGF